MAPARALGIPLLLLLAGVRATGAPLLLEEVLRSAARFHPMLLAQFTERATAEGKLLGSRGAFDTKLTASAGSNSFGYYRTRTGAGGVKQPLRALGGELFGGYKRGGGNFEPWKEGQLTLSGGEWSGGIELPLLRNRRIDQRRTDLLLARLAVELADATILERRLAVLELAAAAYWKWVSAGRKLSVVLELLSLAEDRIQQVRLLAEAGQVAEIEISENERAVLLRRSAAVSAERSLQAARLDLSMFYRDSGGSIVNADRSRLPEFPEPAAIPAERIEADLRLALSRRPEISGVLVELRQTGAVMEVARNKLRPEVNFTVRFGRDTGIGTVSKRGSELIAGITLESPVQRRKASGELAVQNAKQEQLLHKLRYAQDKVEIEVRDAASALGLALRRLQLARAEYDIAWRLAAAELDRFELGDSTLFIVNQREMAAAAARLAAVDALTDCHIATAAYRAATAAL